MMEVDGKRGDKVWCMGEYIVWGENKVIPRYMQQIHPSVHHVNESARHGRYMPSTDSM